MCDRLRLPLSDRARRFAMPLWKGREPKAERHPDLFTPKLAAHYLRVSERTIKTLRDAGHLIGVRMGPRYMYHRVHLDACVVKLFGLAGSGRRSA